MNSDKSFVTNSSQPRNESSDEPQQNHPQSIAQPGTSTPSPAFPEGTIPSLDDDGGHSSNLVHQQQMQEDPVNAVLHVTTQVLQTVQGQPPDRVPMITQQGQIMQPGQTAGSPGHLQDSDGSHLHFSSALGGSSMPSPSNIPAQSTAMQQHHISSSSCSSPGSHHGTSGQQRDQVIRRSNQTASAKQRMLQRHSDHGGSRNAPQPNLSVEEDEPTSKKGRMMTKPDGVKGSEGHGKGQERRYVDQKQDNFKLQLHKEKEKPHVKNTPVADNIVAVICKRKSRKVLVTFNGISKRNLPRVVSAAEPFKVVGAEGVDFRKYSHGSCEVTYENRTYHVFVFLNVKWTPPTKSAMA